MASPSEPGEGRAPESPVGRRPALRGEIVGAVPGIVFALLFGSTIILFGGQVR